MIEISLANKCANADFKKIFARKGYTFFTKGDYNLNIIGVRHKGSKVTNHFDDCLVVIYNTNDKQEVRRVFSCTTLPGKKAMEHPTAIKGTAILKEGQYRGAYQIGYHKGKYKALCQKKPLIVYRDNNKDQVYDLSPISIDRGIFGINIHKAGNDSTLVDGWSYGCHVFSKSIDFNAFMRLVEKSANIYGNSFTYTLINEEDLV
jgi:hypothetical protein